MKKIIALIAFLSIAVSCSKDELPNNNNGSNIIANQQPTGSSSHDLLSDDTFTSMVIELVYVEGYKPTQTAINNLVSFLNARTYKPGGVTVELRSIPSPGISTYSTQDIVNVEKDNRTLYNEGSQIAVWAFFADGEANGNTSTELTLGTAYRNTSFVIYEATVKSLSGGFNQPSTSVLESTVIQHEVGHILGLTNFGAAMQTPHEDTAHPKHCDVESCLMYYAATTGSSLMGISGGAIPQLDSQCIADLRANGGK
ncbi:membrane metalloprotease [Flavobacteriaceae bacterium LMO-SS05]